MIDLNKNNEYKAFLAKTKAEYSDFETDILELIKIAKTVVKYDVNVDELSEPFNELFNDSYHEIQLKLFQKALECTNKHIDLEIALETLDYDSIEVKQYIFNVYNLNTDTALSIPDFRDRQLLDLIFWYATLDVEHVLTL